MSDESVAAQDESAGRSAPEKLFALFSLVGGLLLLALIPPLAGGNEAYNFQRAAGIASGHFIVGPATVPGGMAELLERSWERLPLGSQPPYSYSREDLESFSSIKLGADEPAVIPANPVAVLHPISYLPQAPAIAAGQLLGLPPLAIFYVGRFAGLIAGIALTVLAIRAMPIHKYALAAVAMLPPILFSRSTLDADQFTNGLAFLFLALVIKECLGQGSIGRKSIALLAITGFFLAQSKSAYLLLPLFSLAIPASRFGSGRAKLLSCALICVPGIIASGAWMIALKQTYFHDLRYRTWSGVVRPDEQMQFILSRPLEFAQILLHTIFGTPFIPKVLRDFFGVFGPPVALPILVIPVLAVILTAVILSEDRRAEVPPAGWRVRTFALGLAAATILIILTLLYLQWTRYLGPVIEGFNGRYLYPLAPLLLLCIPSGGTAVFGLRAGHWLALLSTVSIVATCWLTWQTYWV